MSVAHGAKHELSATAHAVSTARRFHIFVNRVATEAENLTDLPIALPLGDQSEAFDLPRTERDAGQRAIAIIDQFAGAVECDRPQ